MIQECVPFCAMHGRRKTRSLETDGAGGRDAGARAERGEARRGTSVGRARDGVVERVDDA